MRISIDANNDSLTIDVDRELDCPQATFKLKNAYQQREILSEMLNRLDIAGVTLEYIDEDVVSSEEW